VVRDEAMRSSAADPTIIGEPSWPARSAATRTNSPEPFRSHHNWPAVPPRYRFHQAMSLVMVEVISTVGPLGTKATSDTGPKSSRRGVPPSVGMAYTHVRRGDACPVALSASTSPSGVQPAARARWSAQ